MKLSLARDVFSDGFTLGKLYVDDSFLGYTVEDVDRHMETLGRKVYGQTAIPRGTYKVCMSWSRRFQCEMPEVLNVPGFTGVRIHGGNTSADTLGCPLLGAIRTATGVKECKGVNDHLRELLRAAERHGEDVFLTVE